MSSKDQRLSARLDWPITDVSRWVTVNFVEKGTPPFAFAYDGRDFSELLARWDVRQRVEEVEGNRIQHVIEYADPATGLVIRCEATAFTDFSAVEWVLRFANEGEGDTEIIEKIHALDGAFRRTGGKIVLHRALGSSAQKTDFAPIHEAISPGGCLRLAPVGGRSSNTTALPFFNLEFEGEGGLMITVGWSGQWAAEFSANESFVAIRAGMELTRLKLRSGECIRTPRILLLPWQGNDYLEGHNLLRRFLIAHHVPKRKGKPVLLPLAGTSSGPPDEANKATEGGQIELASHFAKLGVEYLWIDAGWFEGRWPNGVGNWFVRKDGFPHGLRPVSDAIKDMGMKGLILWFEPERVHKGTWIDREHPDWVLRLPDNPNGLLDLGNDAAREWLTEHVSTMIEREGISVYRQDFNIDPLPFWRTNDPPDRQGITEIRHIKGLYAFWDELRERHPELIIDNCASGGRRIDLETVSRSVALWRTDYRYYEPEGQQCHTYGISLYVPTTSTGCGYPDTYCLRSAMSSGVVLWIPWTPLAAYDIYRKYLPEEVDWDLSTPFPIEKAGRLVDEFKRLRPLFFGDFYPLTPYSAEEDAWIAYQFYRVDMGRGAVLAFRRRKSIVSKMRLRFRGLSEEARYEVHDEDTGETRILTGKELMAGITVEIERAPGSKVLTFHTNLT